MLFSVSMKVCAVMALWFFTKAHAYPREAPDDTCAPWAGPPQNPNDHTSRRMLNYDFDDVSFQLGHDFTVHMKVSGRGTPDVMAQISFQNNSNGPRNVRLGMVSEIKNGGIPEQPFLDGVTPFRTVERLVHPHKHISKGYDSFCVHLDRADLAARDALVVNFYKA